MYVSVVLPCLDERATVAACVCEALGGLAAAGVEGEVVVADNGSTDGSQETARAAGARVVCCAERGYGAALGWGIAAAKGDVIVMADADGTYDLSNLQAFIERLTDADMVIGNRFAGGIEPGAMPPSHRYLGVPVLTWLLNWLFGTRVGDAHCGLRAFTRDAFEKINPQSPGMEFASELITAAALAGLTIAEVPTVLRRGPEGRVPHLRSLRDGWRHVRFLLAARWRGRSQDNLRAGPADGRGFGQHIAQCKRVGSVFPETIDDQQELTNKQQQSREGRPDHSRPMEAVRHLARKAFTIVELLVVIGIIGVLIGLLLAAVQSARESARRTSCKNQVRQLSLAVLLHQEAHGHFPTGGWDWSWLGDPDRGFGRDQPGGWFYNSLPYLEQNELHQMGLGMDYPEERKAHAKRIETSIAGTLCPSRRSTQLYQFTGPPLQGEVINAGPYEVTTRIDYAINAGAVDDVECQREYQEEGGDFTMPQLGVRWCKDTSKFDGISFQQSLVRPAHVTDGLSKTYLLGEKYLNAAEYESGIDWGDNESPYTGVNVDHTRGTSARIELIPDTPGVGSKFAFGSAHGSGFHMAMCDGAVHWVAFDIDPRVHEVRGSRSDGE